MAVFQRLWKLIKPRKYNSTTNKTQEMSITVTVPTEEEKIIFTLWDEKKCISISPNGQFCCFLLFKYEPFNINITIRPRLAALQFIDLSKKENEETKIFKFAEESWFVVRSVYWITNNYIVFLTIDGTSFKQIMFKVNLEEEEEFLTKVCERFYVLNNEIATDWRDWEMSSVGQVIFHGEGYIAWTDRRQEKGSCTGLYLIPENPMNSELKLRKFAMFLSYKNPVTQENERIYMRYYRRPEDFEVIFNIAGQPLVRNNRLLFCISEADGADVFSFVLFGVFLAVDIEKLIEVKGLNYDPIEIENETSAYSVEEWTSLIDREDEIYPDNVKPVQVGKYLLFGELAYSCDEPATLINIEDLSFSKMRKPERRIDIPVLHPFGFILSIKVIDKRPWTNVKLSLGKESSPWNGSSLKDLARRNIMFNKRISQDAKEEYKAVIYKS